MGGGGAPDDDDDYYDYNYDSGYNKIVYESYPEGSGFYPATTHHKDRDPGKTGGG